ncbi:MAG TPA: hypothetical protein VGY31_07990 [Terriglobia bacterium]|nr:hypothetical protein [Terriglobia bacterium]
MPHDEYSCSSGQGLPLGLRVLRTNLTTDFYTGCSRLCRAIAWNRMALHLPARAACFALLSLGCLAAFSRPTYAQTKLYLKDGSYQLVKSYQIEGDRVRYYSLDRSQWEEVPVSLVDFKATQAAAAAEKEQQKQVLQDAEKTAQENYHLPANTGYLIAPGVRLPQGEGVYAYDGMRLITLIQSQGSIERDKKRTALNMALPDPILKSRSLVILPGATAGVRMINPSPVFYAHFTDGTGADIQLLRLKARKNDRIVEGLEARFKGTPTESRADIPLERAQVAPGVYSLKVTQPLTPGEYALAEVDQKKLNLDVWDFGVDSLAPKARK